MKIKLTNLIEGVIISNSPSAFGSPSSSYRNPNQPTGQSSNTFNPAQPFGQPVIPSLPKTSGVYSSASATSTSIATPTPTTGTGSFIVDNPPTTPTPQKPLPAGEAPEMLRPNFNPAQPFGQPLIPTLPLTTKPGAEYSPTPGGVKPKNPTVVVNPKNTTNTPINEPGMSQEDMERDADKWTQTPETAAKPNTSVKPQQQPENTLSQHEKFMLRTNQKLQRDQLTRQAEIEAASHSARLSRIARSRTRIFEQKLQFKPNTLRSLLESVVDSEGKPIKAIDDIIDYFVPSKFNDTLKFYTSPKLAAQRFITATTPHPGDDAGVKFVKSMIGLSPLTWSKIQAGKVASAAAFDPTTGAEKIKHYADIIKNTDPINIAGTITSAIGRASQNELRNRLYYGFSRESSPLNKFGLGTLGTIAGVAGGIGSLVEPYTQAKANVAAKIVAAKNDDWRFAALPS